MQFCNSMDPVEYLKHSLSRWRRCVCSCTHDWLVFILDQVVYFLRRISFQCSYSQPLPSVSVSSLTLSLTVSHPPPLLLLSLLLSANIHRVIWMSYIAGKLWWCQLPCCLGILGWRPTTLNSFQYIFYFTIGSDSAIHCGNGLYFFVNDLLKTLQPLWLADRKWRSGSDFVLLGGPPSQSCWIFQCAFTASCTEDNWQRWLTDDSCN